LYSGYGLLSNFMGAGWENEVLYEEMP